MRQIEASTLSHRSCSARYGCYKACHHCDFARRSDQQRTNYVQRLEIRQDKALRDKAKIHRLVEQSKARTIRLSQKLDVLIAENQRKDELIAQLLAEENDSSSSEEELMEGACALVELRHDL